jgi:hypothetical protein
MGPPTYPSSRPPTRPCAALHDLDPVFRKFSRSDKVAGVLASLGYKRPMPVQSMYIFKVGQNGLSRLRSLLGALQLEPTSLLSQLPPSSSRLPTSPLLCSWPLSNPTLAARWFRTKTARSSTPSRSHVLASGGRWRRQPRRTAACGPRPGSTRRGLGGGSWSRMVRRVLGGGA